MPSPQPRTTQPANPPTPPSPCRRGRPCGGASTRVAVVSHRPHAAPAVPARSGRGFRCASSGSRARAVLPVALQSRCFNLRVRATELLCRGRGRGSSSVCGRDGGRACGPPAPWPQLRHSQLTVASWSPVASDVALAPTVAFQLWLSSSSPLVVATVAAARWLWLSGRGSPTMAASVEVWARRRLSSRGRGRSGGRPASALWLPVTLLTVALWPQKQPSSCGSMAVAQTAVSVLQLPPCS